MECSIRSGGKKILQVDSILAEARSNVQSEQAMCKTKHNSLLYLAKPLSGVLG